jgi:hypothetical protein
VSEGRAQDSRSMTRSPSLWPEPTSDLQQTIEKLPVALESNPELISGGVAPRDHSASSRAVCRRKPLTI